eukprot:GHVU01187894.1.p2 GENE.GHVU01187894.1~~GHVU01187894.1.p2  ORF type:complete len:100 (-),score=4.32 GHVU01187894.1:36-335(-)
MAAHSPRTAPCLSLYAIRAAQVVRPHTTKEQACIHANTHVYRTEQTYSLDPHAHTRRHGSRGQCEIVLHLSRRLNASCSRFVQVQQQRTTTTGIPRTHD